MLPALDEALARLEQIGEQFFNVRKVRDREGADGDSPFGRRLLFVAICGFRIADHRQNDHFRFAAGRTAEQLACGRLLADESLYQLLCQRLTIGVGRKCVNLLQEHGQVVLRVGRADLRCHGAEDRANMR